MEILGKEYVGNVNVEVLEDTVRTNQKIVDGMASDLNGIVTSRKVATVNPNMGNVYELQFKMIQEVVSNLEHNAKVTEE